MINHVVLMKFKPEAQESDIVKLEKHLEELPNKIVEIHSYEFGRDILRSERSYDFALVSLFANVESLERYQKHPEHIKVLKIVGEICDSVIVSDFKGTDASDFKEKQPETDFDSILAGR